MTSPQQWRPAPQAQPSPQYPVQHPGYAQPIPQQGYRGAPVQPGYGPPAPQGYGRPMQQPGPYGQPHPQQAYIPHQLAPNINVTVSPTMNQLVTIGGHRRRTSFWFHFTMTVLTSGLWGIFVWWPLARRRRATH